MNIVTLVGRLTRDPDVRVTQSGQTVTSFTLAVDRRFAKEGQQTADFIPIVVWGKPAEACGKYLAKGNRCGVEGRIQVRDYETKDGSKRYVTEVVANEVEFLSPRNVSGGNSGGSGQFGVNVPDETIPF